MKKVTCNLKSCIDYNYCDRKPIINEGQEKPICYFKDPFHYMNVERKNNEEKIV